MKQLILSLTLLLCLAACDRANRVTRQIEGTWAIEQLTLIDWSGPGLDSVISEGNLGEMEFFACDDPPREFCEAVVQLPSGDMIDYTFQTGGERITFRLQSPDLDSIDLPYRWAGAFDIEERSNRELILSGKHLGDDTFETSDIRIRLVR